MKTKNLIFMLLLICISRLWAQPTESNPVSFNTAIVAGPLYNNITAPLALENGWQVSDNLIAGPYVWATHYHYSPWSSPTVNSDWIIKPYGCDPNNPADPSCNGPVNQYYIIKFNLTGTNPVFAVDWDIWADDKITAVYVNNTLAPNWSPNGGSFASQGSINFKWCSGWVPGQNFIIIHVTSLTGSAGLRVSANASANMYLNGNTTVCQGYALPYTAGAIPAISATNYSWTVPPGWLGGGMSGNPKTLTANGATGPATIIVSAFSGSACLGMAAKHITVIPSPTVNISASAPNVCSGNPVTLTGSGANSYSWIGPGLTWPVNLANPITVYPTSPTTYTLVGYNTNGCNDTTKITIGMLPSPTLFISALPQVICPGISTTLTASGGVSYTWIPSGITQPVLITTLVPGQIVTLTGTGANGCTNTAALSLVAGPVIPVATSDVTLCTNAVSCTNIAASSTFPGFPPTYSWLPGGSGPTINVCPAVTTTYVVTASSPLGCSNTATAVVTVNNNCCSQSTVGLTALNGVLSGIISGGSYLVDQDITVSNSLVLHNAEFKMMPGVKITVPAASDLQLQHVHMYSCGLQMWQGIVLQDKSHIHTFALTPGPNGGANLIEDADIAIDATGLNPYPHLVLMNIFDVVFNKNRIGIQLSNSNVFAPPVTFEVIRCVFTSRNLPYSTIAPFNTGSWPSVSTTSGLRFASSTQVLGSPYQLSGYAYNNLKWPYNNQPGECGIRLDNIVNPVKINVTSVNYTSGADDYNLFDAIRTGIEIKDASLTTDNNVFQNMQGYQLNGQWVGGIGINHSITGHNANHLDLRPNVYFASGNRFWNCWTAVKTQNVYDVNIESAIFRSSHTFANGYSYSAGAKGLDLSSNRFKYNVKSCEFNNIDKNINLEFTSGAYSLPAASSQNGTYADAVNISQNYFGPELTSNTVIGSEFSGDAITINGANASNWFFAGSCTLNSNKINRIYRGIKTFATDQYPVEIGGNEVKLIDDQINPANEQYGIYARNSMANLNIKHNRLTAASPNNNMVKLIRCANNQGNGITPSPYLLQNAISNSYIGFAFEGSQPNTKWECNIMNSLMYAAFSLESDAGTPGYIGQQGGPATSGNVFSGNWGSAGFLTICDAFSNPNASPLYVTTGPFSGFHGGGGTFGQYNNGNFFCQVMASPVTSCKGPSPYLPTPSQRNAGVSITDIAEKEMIINNWNVDVSPNPTSGWLNIIGADEAQVLDIRIFDTTGKTVYTSTASGPSVNIDISLLGPSVYVIEIKNNDQQICRKKLVKVN